MPFGDYPGDKDDKLKASRYPTQREMDVVTDALKRFGELQSRKSVLNGQCEEVAELVDVNSRNTFFPGSFNWIGQKKTERQIDSTGMMALSRFSAIVDSLLTPRNMFWHGLRANDDYVMKDRATQLWFELVTKLLFKLRYAPHANFAAENQKIYRSLGAYGTGCMFVDAFDGSSFQGPRGFRYDAIPFGEMFLIENHQGLVDGFIRYFRMTARQTYQRCTMPNGWGEDRFPEVLKAPLQTGSEQPYEFLHCVWPRTDYDPDRLDAKGKPFGSYYICIASKTLMNEGGYNTFPLPTSRYEQYPNDGPYGRSPAMMILPALKTLNAQKRVFLKQGHRAADPVLLTADDGLIGSVNLRPGAVNPGGMSPDGKPLIGVLPTGDIQISLEMMEEERNLIESAFLVDLFKLSLQLDSLPQMTATQVVEIMNQKGILLAPTIGRQQSEYLGPLIDRELDLAAQMGLLPPMPPRLREAKGSYEIVYTSPLSRAMRSGEAAGFMRTVEIAKEIANATGDPSYLDYFAFDRALPEIADIQTTPASWMATDDEVARKQQVRARAQAIQQQINALPAQAAMVKAQAVASKSGGVAPAQAPATGGPPLAQQVTQ